MGIAYTYFVLVVIAVGLYWWAKHQTKASVGLTKFHLTGIQTEYPEINLEEQRVKGTITYQGVIYMSVYVNILKDTVQVEGSVKELEHITPHYMNEKDYIEEIKTMAAFYIENKIANPKKYLDEMLKT